MDNETKTFTIKGIPESLMGKLRAAAGIEKMTINDLLIAILEKQLKDFNPSDFKIL